MQASLADDAELRERLVQTRLRRHVDKPVGRFVEHASAHGQIGFQRIHVMQRADDEARNLGHVRRDLQTEMARTVQENRALDADKGRKGRRIAVRARWLNMGKLLFYLCRERHSLNTPINASASACGSCHVGRCGSAMLRSSTTGPCAWIASMSSWVTFTGRTRD